MKLKHILAGGQAYWALFLLVFVSVCISACDGKKEGTPIIPPLTSPLSQLYIGYGVVNVSYTRVIAQPEENDPEEQVSESYGSGTYLRQGSVVRIIQRRQVRNQGKFESWVQVDESGEGGAGRVGGGWLRESLLDIYDGEAQAYTASESMGR